MKTKAGTQAALAAALTGMLPTLLQTNRVLFGLSLAAIAILLCSALILLTSNRASGRIWTWFVKRAENIEIEYTAAGLGLVSTGISLLQPGWVILGVIIILVGALLISFGIGNGFVMLRKYIESKQADK
jgi:hypothetical protein